MAPCGGAVRGVGSSGEEAAGPSGRCRGVRPISFSAAEHYPSGGGLAEGRRPCKARPYRGLAEKKGATVLCFVAAVDGDDGVRPRAREGSVKGITPVGLRAADPEAENSNAPGPGPISPNILSNIIP